MSGIDPYYDDVGLLLPLNGAYDFSKYQRPLNVSGVSWVDDAQGYGKQAYFAAGSKYIDISNVNGLTFGANDFTIECQMTPEQGDPYPTLIDKRYGGADFDWALWFRGSDRFLVFTYGTASNRFDLVATGVPVTYGEQQHVAVARGGSTLRIFVGGTIAGAWDFNVTIQNKEPLVRVGWTTGGYSDGDYKGRMRDLRITNRCLYADAFAPPGLLMDFSVPGRTLVADRSSPVAQIGGNATKATGGPVDHVVIRAWDTKVLVDEVTPDTNGAWSARVPPGDYDITYLADGFAPVCHGPYVVADG